MVGMREEELSEILGSEKVISFIHETKKRGRTCTHNRQRYVVDQAHGTVYCKDCEEPVSAFRALCEIADEESRFRQSWAALKIRYDEMQSYKPWLLVVRKLERMWRGKRMLPCCPHCGHGLYAEELTGSAVGIEYETERRKHDGIRTPHQRYRPPSVK